MRALIITHSRDDESVALVTRALHERGARAFRFDTDLFPAQHTLVARRSGRDERVVLARDGDSVEVGELAGAWHWRSNIAGVLPETLDAQRRHTSALEAQRAVHGMLASLPCFVLDPVARIRHAENEPLQLSVARHIGLDTPRTLTTNSPAAVRAFWDECRGKLVTKRLAAFASREHGREQVGLTKPVTEKDLAELAHCPRTFQEHLEQTVELRITIVGDRVFTATLDAGARARSKTDSRREGVARIDAWKPYALPRDVEAGLLKLMDVFALNYGAIDALVTPEGRHVFLELNPAGEFSWLERGGPEFPISEAIADVTIGRAFRRENALATHVAGCC